jgi:transglutaminase-like putative cysteine protease
VPGSYNPLTDLYEVQAKDAHAWVQVWFPGYGWQNFDPTANVPLSNPTPASVLTHDLLATADRVPAVPTLLVAGLVVGVVVVWRRRRNAPPTWAAAVTRDLTEAARRAGVPAEEDETLTMLGARLEAMGMARAPGVVIGPAELALEATRFAYGGTSPPPDQVRRLRRSARQVRSAARRWRRSSRRGPPTPAPPPDPRRTSPRPPARVGGP